MSPSEDSSIWLLLAVVGDPVGETVTWSAQGKETEPATFTVTDTWAQDIATATEEYIELVTSIYTNYSIFRELTVDRFEEGADSVSGPVEQDRDTSS